MKRLYILFAMLCVVGYLQADPVSEKVAKEIAMSWYGHISGTSLRDVSIDRITPYRQEATTTFYIGHFRPTGFVIVAADDASIPILGYSELNSFPEEIESPAVKEWLEDYSRQISQIVTTGMNNRKTKKQWSEILQGNFPESITDVDPLLTTTWGQGCYYNELCPADPICTQWCGHVPTGCVATAMAQVMRYHEFPPQGVDTYSYNHWIYGEQSANFGNTTYDWASMPDAVTSSNIEVATIMYHAGVSVNMEYTNDGSAAFGVDVIKAFVDYFNYKPGLEWHARADYTDPEDWKELLRSDLDNLWPVFYTGNGPTDGHAFVCDGYRISDEKFHFNWGWESSYDGWYAIGGLNPGTSFNQDNFALIHLRPDNPDLITRVTSPYDRYVVGVDDPITIEASTVRGTPETMYITIDGTTVASGSSNTLNYTWNTTSTDLGSHDVRAWAVAGDDTVWYPTALNVSEWETQSSGFQTSFNAISSISTVDCNVAWATAWNGLWSNNMFIPCQDYTRTTDGGATWTAGTIPNADGLTSAMVFAMNADKAYVLMYKLSGSNLPGVFVTTDGGTTWSRQATALFNSPFSFPDNIHFFNENEGWCMGDPTPQAGGFEMYTTTDGGANWTPVPAGNIPASWSNEYGMTEGYSAAGETIWFGTTRGRIFKSTDKGLTWTVSVITALDWEFITPEFRDESHGLVHNFFDWPDEGKIYETFDGGITWTEINYTGKMYFTDLAYVPGTENTWVSTGGWRAQLHEDKGASVSFDGGHTWEKFPGTEGAAFRHMDWVNNQCGWAGGHNLSETEGGVFKFDSDFPVSSKEDSEMIEMSLNAYPNPFSSSITIEFILEKRDEVDIIIYNQYGQQVDCILQSGTQGINQVKWDASALPAGIYVCRITAGDKTATKKMVLVR